MYHPTRRCGVLTDFDSTVFALLKRIPGTHRTGTIPFMALELLEDEYCKDNITCRYHHELEAFVWMLPIVFLAYDNGKFDRKAPFVIDWMASDYSTCHRKKLHFATVRLAPASTLVKAVFKDYAFLMFTSCFMICDLFTRHRIQENLSYRRKLARQAGLLSDGNVSPPILYVNRCVVMWEEFLSVLSESSIDCTRLREHKPAFDSARSNDLFQEMRAIFNSFHPLA